MFKSICRVDGKETVNLLFKCLVHLNCKKGFADFMNALGDSFLAAFAILMIPLPLLSAPFTPALARGLALTR
ncbi:MAG: hypothetical protein CMI32_08660 [Opitutales bacterium]|nr:hypothetical protein [Opitutales bacterium]